MNPSLVHNAQESQGGKVTSVHKGVHEMKNSSERMNVRLTMGGRLLLPQMPLAAVANAKIKGLRMVLSASDSRVAYQVRQLC